MRRTRTADERGLSLVPMADMLTNTVGIMLFIMAFTILASAGAVVLRRLPKESSSQAAPVFFVCVNQRVLPMDRALAIRLAQNLPKPTFSTIDNWLAGFNASQHEDDFFVVSGRGKATYNLGGTSARLSLSASYVPKKGAGDSAADLKASNSRFASALEKRAGATVFAYFVVYPDSVDVFREARQIAAEKYRISSGWTPMGPGNPITVSLTSEGGITPEPQSN